MSDFQSKLATILQLTDGINWTLEQSLESNPTILAFSKWGCYLPNKYKLLLLKERYFDFDGAVEFLKNVTLVYSHPEIA